MNESLDERSYVAFDGDRLVARGTAAATMEALETLAGNDAQILIFADATSEIVEWQRLAWLAREDGAPSERRGPGRPRLGVVAREVTLLPRHWEWLAQQPGGASVALRKLVDQARHANEEADHKRQARDRAYRLMSALAGDRPGYEEALRALYAGDRLKFQAEIADWPADIRTYVASRAAAAF
ncbi:hypothetical protein SAMN07250955_11826 [Arboricoccus pini]|uniref:DUF2239 domain-containing protein n=1 Tax=Arboricoccus pini TaxID=1963835 RepID=A0A212RZL3_9PROT|nr:DUF2239 family protein [Arboricoccus pini]SNB78258.1 hypothetical protein SAMN07250955_11826 [Arboricoccus pini]